MNPVGPIFAGTGSLLLLLGLLFYWRTSSFLARAVPAEGVVVDFRTSRGSEGGTTYRPVVSFQTHEGEAHQFTDAVSTNPPGFSIGDPVPIAYDPANPGRAKITKPFRLWFVTGLMTGLGGLFLLLGVILTLTVPSS